MDNAQKAIMIGVGLFITILIIAAVMIIVNPAIGLLNKGQENVIEMEEALINMLYQKYDDTTVYGSEVISVAQQWSVKQMVVEVQPSIGGDILELGKVRGNGTVSLDKGLKYDSSNVQTKASALMDSSNTSTYVPTTAKYNAKLVRSSTGDTVMGVIFTRVK